MVDAIPKWVMQRYSVLYKAFGNEGFNRDGARKAIAKAGLKGDDTLTNTFFSQLNKKGWVIVERDKRDSRKKIFRLVPPEKALINLNLD